MGKAIGIAALCAALAVGCGGSQPAPANHDAYRLGPVATLADKQPAPWGVAIDSTHVYWTNLVAKGAVMEASLADGTVKQLAVGAQPARLAVLSGVVYFTDAGDGTVESASETIGKKQVAPGFTRPARIAIAGNTAYLTDELAGAVSAIDLASGKVTRLAPGPSGKPLTTPTGIAVTDSYVYWSDTGGAVSRVPTQGGPSEHVASLGEPLQDMAIADGALFVGGKDGIVWRVELDGFATSKFAKGKANQGACAGAA